jgi:hypothetical protein
LKASIYISQVNITIIKTNDYEKNVQKLSGKQGIVFLDAGQAMALLFAPMAGSAIHCYGNADD